MAGLSRLAEVSDSPGVLVTPTRRLSASWHRSEIYEVPPNAVNPTFTGAVDDGSLFYECGLEVLRGLQETLADEPVSLMLTDAEGIVLNRVCEERTLAAALDGTYLAPGFAYSEREVGTNGLGLALADRAPSLVRGDEHFCTALRGYTCAAAPVVDPVDGGLVGSVNLTTWSDKSDGLLLALAQTAAGHTSTLMLARSRGAQPRPAPRGEVFRVVESRHRTRAPEHCSQPWRDALNDVETALANGATIAVVGERGAGKSALLATALHRVRPHDRVLNARPPAARDAGSWLALWSPELGKDHTSVIAGRVDELPLWVAAELAAIVGTRSRHALAVTASEAAAVPEPLARLVDVVVEVPPLRHRSEDVLPLAEHFGRQVRNRDVQFTPAAARALRSYHWPGNVEQLRRTVRDAATRSTVVDLKHVPPEVLCGASHALTRIEALERDEIARCLAEPGMTVTRAADMLGISRATAYRRIARYGIRILK
jgi:hypothetical protein